MLKKIKSITCFLLMVILLLPTLVSCSSDGSPEGYQLVACYGDKFRLYVPQQGWMPNTSSGITGAYFSMKENASVSAYIADDAGELSVSEYWEMCNQRYEKELNSYQFSAKPENIMLDGEQAIKYIYTAKLYVNDNWVKYKFMQVMARHKGEIYILLYSAPEEYYDTHVEDFEGKDVEQKDNSIERVGIVPYFRFADPYYPKDEKKFSDKVNCPDGMKLISTNERPYRFFVPENWITDMRTEISSAYFSEDDRSNVTLQGYMSDEDGMSVSDFWNICEEKYKNLYESFILLTDTESKMGDLRARKYIYTIETGGEKYKVMQTVCIKGAMFYIMTYTALEENFDKHLDDVQKMTEAFTTR